VNRKGIKVKVSNDSATCMHCGANNYSAFKIEILEIEISNEHKQSHAVRLCRQCASVLKEAL